MKFVPVVIASLLVWTSAGAWGPVGHRIVAETAALLVETDRPDDWGPLFGRHRFQLGVYAFLPDAVFRHVDGAGGAIEAPTHVLELDETGKPTGRGSAPARASQFLGLAKSELAGVRRVRGGYQPGAAGSPEAHRIFLGLYDLGVMAHYSGDASQPFHATSDTNGYGVGQGGIHFYFENDCVDALEPGLAEDVLASARRNRSRWLAAWGARADRPAELMAALFRDSRGAVARVLAGDKRHAVTSLAPPGTQSNAARRPASSGCPPLRSVLVERLAKGAVATAYLWESALPEGVDFSEGGAFQLSDMNIGAPYLPPDDAAPAKPVAPSTSGASSPRARRSM